MNPDETNTKAPHRTLPDGTQVVLRTELRAADGAIVRARGAVGVIVTSSVADAHYCVQFLDGFRGSFPRAELTVLAEHQSTPPTDRLANDDLYPYVIYRCVVGSRAFGLDDADSDTDRRGMYLPPAVLHWSLAGVPEQLENTATEETYWEAQKFVALALKANPNVLECLYTPLVEHATPLAEELRDVRQAFLSKLVYQTYNGYVTSQFKKLQSDLRNKGAVKWKHVMHLLRLLLAGVTTLEEARVPVDVGPYRERLLAIKRGEISLDECETWRLELHKRFDAAFARTTLPDRPDYPAANDWLIRARRSMIG